jgi:hypothetical protein
MFNETNRDDVVADLLIWLERHQGCAARSRLNRVRHMPAPGNPAAP